VRLPGDAVIERTRTEACGHGHGEDRRRRAGATRVGAYDQQRGKRDRSGEGNQMQDPAEPRAKRLGDVYCSGGPSAGVTSAVSS
jgi:hypothetical protein